MGKSLVSLRRTIESRGAKQRVKRAKAVSSLIESMEQRRLFNAAPFIAALSATPTPSVEVTFFTLTAHQVRDDGAVTAVNFFQDSNHNGRFDKADAMISGGTAVGSDWSSQPLVNPAAPGALRFFAVAVDNVGRRSAPRSVSVAVQLSGTVNGNPTDLTRADFPGAVFDRGARTWLLIHGRASTPAVLGELVQAVHAVRPADQILTLDWSSLAAATNDLDFSGQDAIRPVGKWAAGALIAYGLPAVQLNLVGHSWGADVADELARSLVASHKGKVQSMVALDAAAHVPKGLGGVRTSYNQDVSVNLRAHASESWDVRASPLGSTQPPGTSSESFDVDFQSLAVPELGHGLVVPAFASLITNSPIFSLDRLTGVDSTPRPWQSNAFDDDDAVIPGGGGTGTVFEAEITADTAGTPLQLQYRDASSSQLVVVTL